MSVEPETGWTDLLDSWRFWMGVAYVGLTLTIVGLYFVNARTSNEVAVRRATESANATNAYMRCKSSRPTLTKLNTHLGGVNDLAKTITLNSLAIVAATSSADPQYLTRVANLRRIRAAALKIAAVEALPVPSVADCLKLRPRD